MSSRKQATAERRARQREARAKVAHLRAQLRSALAAKKQRMRELASAIRAERVALRDRIIANRKRFLEELRSWERTQRAEAREAWARRRGEARAEALGDIARARAETAAERAHATELRRIEREVHARAAGHAQAQTDDDVRALVPAELVPLFDRLKQSIRGGAKRSRAEVFLHLAAQRTEDVFKVVEPRVEQMIRDTILELARTRRAARSCASPTPTSAR